MAGNINDIFAVVPQNEYDNLICRIDNLWTQAKNRAVEAVNTELLDANCRPDGILSSLSKRVRFVLSMENFL